MAYCFETLLNRVLQNLVSPEEKPTHEKQSLFLQQKFVKWQIIIEGQL